jgi:hypothetical protein
MELRRQESQGKRKGSRTQKPVKNGVRLPMASQDGLMIKETYGYQQAQTALQMLMGESTGMFSSQMGVTVMYIRTVIHDG